MTTEITLYEKVGDPVNAVQVLGGMFARSGMFGCEKKEQGEILALQCLSERISPLDLARRYHIIQGKLSMRSDAMLGEFHVRGGKSEWVQYDNEAAICKFTMPDGQIKEISFAAKDAENAGLLPAKAGSGWAKYPDAMLRARCISKAMRMLMPEIVAGMYTPEEVEDFDPPKHTANPRTQVATLESTDPNHKETMGEMLEGELVSDSEPAPQTQTAEMATMKQRNFINGLFAQLDIKDRDAAMAYIKEHMGLEVAGTGDLTKDEASNLVTMLKADIAEAKEVV